MLSYKLNPQGISALPVRKAGHASLKVLCRATGKVSSPPADSMIINSLRSFNSRENLCTRSISQHPDGSQPLPPPPPPPRPGKGTPAPSRAPEEIPSYFQPDAPAVAPAPEVYQAVPQYPIAPPPLAEPSLWSQLPPLVWVGIGVVLANVFNAAMSFFKGGPQKMQEMAMQQMMNQMMKQAMKGQPPGASPFGGPGMGFPPMPSMPSGFASQQAPIDTTATSAASPFNTPPPPRQQQQQQQQQQQPPVNSSSPPQAEAPKARKKTTFVDVDASPPPPPPPASSSSSSPSPSTAQSPPASNTSTNPAAAPPLPPFMNGGAAQTAAPPSGGPGTSQMLDMLKDPKMQQMLYPYLPEPMRNPETFEWMLNNPEYRAQLESMIGQQAGAGGNPALADMMQGVDMSPDKMQAQFDALGMSPDQFIQKVMADPDLSGMMTNPRIMTAIAECTKDPMNIFKYQNDEEVMKVFEKMQQLFPQAASMGAFPPSPPS